MGKGPYWGRCDDDHGTFEVYGFHDVGELCNLVLAPRSEIPRGDVHRVPQRVRDADYKNEHVRFLTTSYDARDAVDRAGAATYIRLPAFLEPTSRLCLRRVRHVCMHVIPVKEPGAPYAGILSHIQNAPHTSTFLALLLLLGSVHSLL